MSALGNCHLLVKLGHQLTQDTNPPAHLFGEKNPTCLGTFLTLPSCILKQASDSATI